MFRLTKEPVHQEFLTTITQGFVANESIVSFFILVKDTKSMLQSSTILKRNDTGVCDRSKVLWFDVTVMCEVSCRAMRRYSDVHTSSASTWGGVMQAKRSLFCSSGYCLTDAQIFCPLYEGSYWGCTLPHYFPNFKISLRREVSGRGRVVRHAGMLYCAL